MAQDYDNMGKNLWTEHADDLSRFVLDQDDVEVLSILMSSISIQKPEGMIPGVTPTSGTATSILIAIR